MLGLKYVADMLQDKLHEDGRIAFNVTDVMQHWFGYSVKNADGSNYVPIVINVLGYPRIRNNYDTRTLMYEGVIKGVEEDRMTVEAILNSLNEFTIDGNKWYISDFRVDEITKASDNGRRVAEYRGRFRLDIDVPLFITGNDIGIKINDVDVEAVGGGGIFDKALISNIAFGDNNVSNVNTGEEITFTFPLSANAMVTDIFSNVVDKTFNKQYQFDIDFGILTKRVDLTLTNGTYQYSANNDVFRFNATFERTLPRTVITINDYTVAAIGFIPSMTMTPSPRQQGNVMVERGSAWSYAYNFQLENDGSQLITQLLNEYDDPQNKEFIIEHEVNGKLLSQSCVLKNISFPIAENPNAIIIITLGVGDFAN